MIEIKIKNKPEKVVKRALKLAWDAAGGPVGMGVFQDKPDATEMDIWNNVVTNGDYPGMAQTKPGRLFADYVFGRMLKLGLEYKGHTVSVPDREVNPSYQAWASKYPDYRALILEADKQVSEP